MKVRKKIFVFALVTLALVFTYIAPGAASPFHQVNLVSDGNVGSALAAYTDPNLINPWGIASSATSPFWVANRGTGVSTLYNGSGVPQSLVVTIPAIVGTPPSSPTGAVFYGGSYFLLSPSSFPARFLFATADGTISGWNPGASATSTILKVDNSGASAVYTGLAYANNGSGDFLYAANFHSGFIDVFDSTFAPTTLAGGFLDPNLPSGYAPYNIHNLGGQLFVTYALQNATGTADVSGAGHGFVNVFDTNGNLIQRLISDGVLNSPWGLALAPAGFGGFSNAPFLLVANAGDGLINAFDPATGALLGTFQDSGGDLTIAGLRGLIFGNGGNGGDPNLLYFTAGSSDHGLLGSLAPVPLPGAIWLLGTGLVSLIGLRRKLKS